MGVRRGLPAVLLALGLATGCAARPEPEEPRVYAGIRSENVRSILVVPVVNNTVDVDAPDHFLSTLSVPVADHGYYVFPVNLVKRVMEEEGLSDANLVHAADPTRLGELFGADAILYVTIENWETTYLVLAATTTVAFSYVLKSGRTGKVLWRGRSTVRDETDSSLEDDNGEGIGGFIATLVVMAVESAVDKATPNYVGLARKANRKALHSGGKGLPAGPYSAIFDRDDE